MTIKLKEAKKRFPEAIIKSRGYWNVDKTQLIYRSELIGKDDVNRNKKNIYLINDEEIKDEGVPYYLPSNLKQMMVMHQDGATEWNIADVIYNSDNQYYKLPLKYLYPMDKKDEPSVVRVKADSPVSLGLPPTKYNSVEPSCVKVDIPLRVAEPVIDQTILFRKFSDFLLYPKQELAGFIKNLIDYAG